MNSVLLPRLKGIDRHVATQLRQIVSHQIGTKDLRAWEPDLAAAVAGLTKGVPVFPLGNSELAGLIRRMDWTETPLGAIEGWPASLRNSLNLILASPMPMALMWGKPGVMLYNDAYVPIAGQRHPVSLGSSVFDTWPEVADFNVQVLDQVFAGKSLRYPDLEFAFDRNGPRERVFLDLHYSPVSSESGKVEGVLAVLTETTQSHVAREDLKQANRKLAFLDKLGTAIGDSRGADDVLACTTRMTAEHLCLSNCAYADMDDDGDGFTIRGDWHAADSPSILGHYSLADFGALAVRELNAGRPLIINDNLNELPEHEAKTFQDIGIAATICMPLIKGGRLTALMAIHDCAPRAWTDYDLDIISEVTERSWAHIERVGMEAELRASAAALRDLNDTLEQRVAQRTEQLQLAEDALRQSQKMEAVGQLTGGIAHDFNNMLTGIIGGLDIVQRRIEQGRTEDLGRFMDGARLSAQRAAALTARLLAFSRRQSLDSKPTDINALLTSLEALLKGSIKDRIDLTIVKASELAPALVDANQLENAILNLAINARDAMPDGGTLTITTRVATADDRGPAPVGALEPGLYVAIDVRDTGVGMDAATANKAFEPFFTTKPVGQGTGLGLSMVYGFARQSNGCVSIVSTPGGGTCVTIMLPVAQQEPIGDTVRPIRNSEGNGETVLVVEDDPSVRLLICDVLDELGYRARDTATPQEAINLFNRGDRFDLMVTDVGLPGMNGRQLADIARLHDRDLPILFVTGYAENAALRSSFLGERMQMMTKPFQVEELSARIRDILKEARAARMSQ